MNKIYFVSDTHFEHKNIIEYCNRPFKDTYEMNNYIINKWNNTVDKTDVVYFLGDFALGGDLKESLYETLSKRLNGHILFLKGNHDLCYDVLDKYFLTIQNKHTLTFNGYNFILSHFPLPDEEIPDGYINIHGHIHNYKLNRNKFNINNHFNVSVETLDYKPIDIHDIIATVNERKSIQPEMKGELNMRKLATIQKIIDIQPIPDADAIEVATIKGWKVVIRKNEFKVGDFVVYFEIDSLIPRTHVTEFLFKSDEKEVRLRTVKLRGQVSQGLLLSLDSANEMALELNGKAGFNIAEGEDLSDLLHIEKYEPPVRYGDEGRSIYWPFSLPKTDEERIQNMPEIIDEIINSKEHLCISVKLDGTSMTVIRQPDGVHVAGRNSDFDRTDEVAYNNKYWSTAKKYNLPEILDTYYEQGELYAVQGELVGPGIQNNRMNLSELDLYIFNLFKSNDGGSSWVKQGYNELIEFCAANNLKHVPYIYSDFDLKLNNLTTVDGLLKFAEGTYKDNAEGYFPNAKTNQQREGLVFRTLDHSKSFKVINNLYLLKGGD